MLTPEKYQKLKALLADNGSDLSDEFRAKAQAAVDGYKNEFLARGQGVQKSDHLASNPLAMPAEQPMESPLLSVGSQASGRPTASAPQAAPNPDEARVQQLVSQLDPSLSLPAQVLAMQPGTNHPGGDEAAKEEWIRGDLNNPNGVVIAYDMPVSEVRKKLLEKPELYRALQMSVPTDPESVMSIQEGDSTHQAYNDYFFKEAADAATKAGKSIYRRSKAPWLGDGTQASRLDTLKTKLASTPAAEPQAFLLGFDDSAMFGAVRAAGEGSGLGFGGKLNPEDDEALRKSIPAYGEQNGKEPPKSGPETVGGIPEDLSMQERNDVLEESYPKLHTAGQALGTVLGPAASLWSWLTAAGAPAKTALGGVARGAARGAGAGAVDQGVRETMQAASSDDAGASLAGAPGRVLGAAAAGMAPEALGGGIRGASNQVTDWVQWGKRYKGAPGRVESHGVEPKLGKGHVAPPVVKDAELRGRKEGGRDALTVLASDLDEPLGDAARYRREESRRVSAEKAEEHYASPEGGHTLPMRNLVEVAAQRLRQLTSEVPKKGLKGVAKQRTDAPLKDVFNANIEGVSARPTKHGVELSAKEARSFLSPEWQAKLDLDKLEKAGKPVYVTPRRYDSQHADEVIEQLGKGKDEHLSAVREAAIADRAARGGGAWGSAKEKLDADVAKAKQDAKRVGADRPPGGTRAVVEAAGKGRGQHEAVPALRESARAAGGDAPEKLRGALIAEDLGDLENWSTVGGRNPIGEPRALWGLTALSDKAILKGVYPASRKLAKTKPGAASKVGRAAAAATRNVTDDRDDDRRKERDEKKAEGYGERAKAAGAGKGKSKLPIKFKRPQRGSEAQQ